MPNKFAPRGRNPVSIVAARVGKKVCRVSQDCNEDDSEEDGDGTALAAGPIKFADEFRNKSLRENGRQLLYADNNSVLEALSSLESFWLTISHFAPAWIRVCKDARDIWYTKMAPCRL